MTTNTFLRISYFGMNVNILVGDGILIWRTWRVCSDLKSAKYLLVILMAGSVGTNVADIVVNTIEDAIDRSIVMNCIFPAFSLAVRLLGTSLIALTAWKLRRQKRGTILEKMNCSGVGIVLRLLVESGMIYCACQATFILIQILNMRSESQTTQILTLAISMITNAVTVLNPLAVFLVAHLNRSPLVETFYLH
ncbi:hypothetical protein GYMLUDRAFT_90450 [Collybiopsis luxurians FD-317 M1]|nr:hypothetical protein GYMLUDRAFT_90450 [Collybiopsis luxurians FD-317 M1]